MKNLRATLCRPKRDLGQVTGTGTRLDQLVEMVAIVKCLDVYQLDVVLRKSEQPIEYFNKYGERKIYLMQMKQLLHFITLGAHDLDKMKNWYVQKFGWKPMKDENGIVFFKLNGFILGLFPADELAEDIGIPQEGKGFRKFSLAINFHSEKEVDQAVDDLRKKGVKIVKEPQKVFWGGYHAYVADAEDNYWELAYNPFLKMDKDGNVVSHD